MNDFAPSEQTTNINVGATSASVLVSSDDGIEQVRVMNNGTATVWIQFGHDNTVVAAVATSMPVGPGAREVLTAPQGAIWVAAIAAGATGKIYFTPGMGR